MVEGDIFKDVDIYMIFLLLGNFRLVRCLHCNKLVRRGKDGCTSREASNSGMAAHMRSKHDDKTSLNEHHLTLNWVPVAGGSSELPILQILFQEVFFYAVDHRK